MAIAGMLLKANEVRIVALAGNKANHSLIAQKFNKLALNKNPNQDDVKVFIQAFKTYCSDNGIEKIIINRRSSSGKMAGGAGTFLIEGVILAISSTIVEFVHSATIRATDKREASLKTEKPGTVDLDKAYDLAFEGLN